MNPCSKVTICDAIQPGSICCLQVNDTAHPGTGAWVSCGTTWQFTTAMSETGMVVGMILLNGADCGYVFAPGRKVTASIAFTCDRSAVGGGRVAASKTGFLQKPLAAAGGGGLIGGKPATMDAAMFCNLNFTWATSQVCNLPVLAANQAGHWGIWFMVVVGLLVGGYFGGFTYYRSQQPGADPVFLNNMHNKQFWDEVPVLIKDGITFIQSGGQAQTHYGAYAVVDDVEDKPKPPPKRTPPKGPKGPPKGTTPAKRAQSTPPPRGSAAADGDSDEDA